MSTLELMSKILTALARLEETDAKQATLERSAIDERGIHTATAEDLERIQAKITECEAPASVEAFVPPAASRPPPDVTQAAPAPRASLDDEPWSPEQDFGPFIHGLQGGMGLVDCVEALLDTTDFEAVVRHATELFVDELGFDASPANETARVGRSDFRHVRRIAQHDEFFIVATELKNPSHYATFYDALFRLHPYGLVLSVEPDGGCLRFVSRESVSAPLRYQVGRGLGMSWQVHDDVVVLAGRVDRMRPRFTDDAISLQRRVHQAVTASYRELAADWMSRDLPITEDPPGIGWDEVVQRGVRSFLQMGREGASLRRWGLEAVLRDLFPMGLERGRFTLRYRGHEAPRIELQPEPRARITLHLRLEGDRIASDFDREVTLPWPNDDGLIEGKGVELVFTPSETVEAAWDVDDEDDEALEEEVASLDEEEAPTSADNHETETPWFDGELDDARASVEPSWSFEFRLRYAARRQLLRMRRRLWFARGLDGTVDEVRKLLQRLGDPMSLLAPPDWYLAGLARASHTASSRLRAIQTGGLPPAWACLDISSALPPGDFVPVSGARLHPCGVLTVPMSLGRDYVRLDASEETACVVNARAGGAGGGHDTWWIAPLARTWASRPPSPFPDPRALLDARSVESRHAVVLPGQRLRCVATPSVLRRLGWHDEVLEQRVPDLTGTEPSLVVAVNSELEPGDVWLRVPASQWPGAPPVGECSEERLAREILDLDKPDEAFELRVPPGIEGRVIEATVERVQPDTDPGFVARVVVRRRRGALGQVLLPDGRLAPLEAELMPWDAPYDTAGHAADFVVYDPNVSGNAPFFDGLTDEEALLGSVLPHDSLTWLSSERLDIAVGPDRHMRFRIVDGEGVATHRTSPTLSEAERDRWAALDPDTYAQLAAAENALHAHLPAWMPALFRALSTAAAPPSLEMPTPWPSPEHRPRVKADDLGDPIRTQIKAIRATSGSQGPHALLEWRDVDGRVVDPKHAMEGRPEEQRVELRQCDLRSEPLPALPLCIPVLHPWKRQVAAALLGIDLDELRSLMLQFGPADILEVCRRALEQPWAALRRRLETAAKDRRSALQRAGWHLERELASYDTPHLSLDYVPVPAPELLLQGAPPGAPGLLGSPLMVACRRVVQANEVLAKLDLPSRRIHLLAEVTLQGEVDRLFGTSELPEAVMGPRTIAGFARHLWPLTRPRELRSASPAVGSLAGELVDEVAPGAQEILVHVRRDVESRAHVLPTPNMPHRPTCWTHDGPRPIPTPARETVAALDDVGWWRARAARSWVLDEQIPFFAALFDAASRLVPELDPRRCLHRFVTDLLFRRDDPTALVEVLTRSLPLRLPNDDATARAQVDELVTPSVGDAEVRSALCAILSSFWSTAPDGTSVGGWRCAAFDGEPAPGSARAIPHRGSPAWLRIPGVAAIDEPIRHLLDGRQAPGQPEAMRARLGLAVEPFGPVEQRRVEEEPAPVALQTVPPPALTQAPPAPAEVELPEPELEEIRPLRQSLASWLHPIS